MSNGTIGDPGGLALGANRRRLVDRRELSWRTFVRGSITPRRRVNRRSDESESLIDWHEPHLLFLAIAILMLSVADAFLTLILINRGAEEVNPVMAYFIESAPRLFVAVKMALTGLGIVILVALARAKIFYVVRISNVIHWCLVGYLLLIVYEAWLLRQPM